MAKVVLTDRMLAALKPAAKGQRADYMDGVVPGFGVRVTDKADNGGKAASRTFILVARFPGSKNPVRRSLGGYPVLSLEDARKMAREWLGKIASGIDPAEEAKQREAEIAETARRAEVKQQALNALAFGVVIEDYIRRHVRPQRTAYQTELDIRRELVPVWKDRPITSITKGDVVKVVEAIADRPAPYLARQVFSHIRTFFNWAINRDAYPGLESSPCDRLSPVRLVGAPKPRKRVLSNDELFAYWRAAGRLDYPFGPMLQMLALTGCRRDEIAEAKISELHPQLARMLRKRDGELIEWRRAPNEIKLLTVPPERFKSDCSHLVPLTGEALAVLGAIPNLSGAYLFSTTLGEKPISGFSKAKARLDRRMLSILKALARKRGDDPAEVELRPFILHDVRRTVRTGLSALRVDENIAELIIGHGKKGLARVYNQHEYLDEMREGLEKWSKRVREITAPAPANVVAMGGRARR